MVYGRFSGLGVPNERKVDPLGFAGSLLLYLLVISVVWIIFFTSIVLQKLCLFIDAIVQSTTLYHAQSTSCDNPKLLLHST